MPSAATEYDVFISYARRDNAPIPVSYPRGWVTAIYEHILADHRRYSTAPEWQRDLSVSFEKHGDLATAQGNLPEARRLFGESLRIRQRLAESDPANANAEWQRDLWVSYWRMADLSEKTGQAAEANGWWKKAYATLAGMKQRGLHVSPEDEGFLERRRAKVGG